MNGRDTGIERPRCRDVFSSWPDRQRNRNKIDDGARPWRAEQLGHGAGRCYRVSTTYSAAERRWLIAWDASPRTFCGEDVLRGHVRGFQTSSLRGCEFIHGSTSNCSCVCPRHRKTATLSRCQSGDRLTYSINSQPLRDWKWGSHRCQNQLPPNSYELLTASKPDNPSRTISLPELHACSSPAVGFEKDAWSRVRIWWKTGAVRQVQKNGPVRPVPVSLSHEVAMGAAQITNCC